MNFAQTATETTVAVYFGGFNQSELPSTPNVFSSWIASRGKLDDCLLNLSGETDYSLARRWRRAERIVSRLRNQRATVHILAYSMGCHLAVKFAHELSSVPNGSVSFAECWLIAPDPKFIRNELDYTVPSAYAEAKRLWQTNKCPGEVFCERLCELAKRLPRAARIVYSLADTVATWEDNVARLQSLCSNQAKMEWMEAAIGVRTRSDLSCTCTLDPSEAKDEWWIHDQLFTKTKISAAVRSSDYF